MRTTKFFTAVLAVAFALLINLDSQASTIYEVGENVYSVCEETEQLNVDSLAGPVEAYVYNNVVYLHSTTEDSNTLYIFGDVESISIKGGEIEIITDDSRIYIYTLGENAEIEEFLETV